MACAPTILGYWSIGFAAGAIGSVAGFSLLDIAMLAGLLYAGSAQFMFYSLHAAGAGLVAIALSILLVNLRYLLMSSYLAGCFRGAGFLEKLVAGALLTDETFGVAVQFARRHGALPFGWLLGLNLAAYLNWVVANLTGALFASALPQEVTSGLGFSLTAMFVGLLLANLRSSPVRLIEYATIAVASATVVAAMRFHLADAKVTVIVSTVLAAALGAALLRRHREAEILP